MGFALWKYFGGGVVCLVFGEVVEFSGEGFRFWNTIFNFRFGILGVE